MAAAMKDTLSNVLDKLHLSSGTNSAAPREPSEEELRSLKEKYEKANQGQVFAFYDSLSGAERGILYDQLASIDPEYIL
jgi:UDP-N-acetylglucosamine/UDP-N-acetylgalactosamine diphosphorylase